MAESGVELSIVTPVYQAKAFLDEFYRRMTKAASSITQNYEIIFVNDGSTDGSLEKLLGIHAADPKVVVVDLMRNFGQAKTLRTGLHYARGRKVFAIDDDLEEQPEWLEQFIRTQETTGADVVFSAQARRRGGWADRALVGFFFFFMMKVLRAESVANVMTARLMTQAHVEALRLYKEHNASFTILNRIAGCSHVIITFDKRPRSVSSYSLYKRWRLMVTHVTSASSRPLLLPLFMSGFWFTAWLCGCGTEKLMLMGIGFLLATLAILALYLSEVIDDIRGRPMTVIRKLYVREAI